MTSSLVGSEMCIRDSGFSILDNNAQGVADEPVPMDVSAIAGARCGFCGCLLYTSDAADDM
eukprot:5484642-Prorocentrum_lima.AAC.1